MFSRGCLKVHTLAFSSGRAIRTYQWHSTHDGPPVRAHEIIYASFGDTVVCRSLKVKLAKAVTLSGLEQAAADSASQSWIAAFTSCWSGRDYIRATQLRNNNLPTMAIPSKNPLTNKSAGLGVGKTDDMPCTSTMHDHSMAKDSTAQWEKNIEVERTWVVKAEHHVRHSGNTLFKLDLVVLQDKRAVIADITENW